MALLLPYLARSVIEIFVFRAHDLDVPGFAFHVVSMKLFDVTQTDVVYTFIDVFAHIVVEAQSEGILVIKMMPVLVILRVSKFCLIDFFTNLPVLFLIPAGW